MHSSSSRRPSPARPGTDSAPLAALPRGSSRRAWSPGARAILVAGLVAAFAGTALAQDPDSTAADDGARSPDVEVAEGSPRAAVERFLLLERAGRHVEAAAWLDLPDSLADRGPEFARKLKAALDRHLWVDLDALSPVAAGDTADGLPPLVDQVGVLPDADGIAQPVRIARARVDGAPRWRFTRGTVARIPVWYDALEDRWIREHLPEPLLRPGPFDILWWQWIALPVLLLAAITASALARRLVVPLVRGALARTDTTWDDAIAERLGAPLAAGFTLALVAGVLPMLRMYDPAQAATYRVLRVAFFVVFFWGLWRLVDVVRDVAALTRWARTSASSRSLLPLGARIAKVAVVAIAVVATLSLLGYPVTGLVAGLGIGGLALALAAQKTVENLFGAFSIGVDQPFREGDFVKVEDFVGTVEAIGLRSTRFRTLDRTIVTLPNGKLADMRLESFAARDRLRLATVIGLVYETTGAQVREVLEGFERVLRAHPKIWPDAVVVRFREFGASSLDIEIMAWFQTSDWGEFQLIRQEILLQFMDVVERAGSSFAFPTRTVHLVDSRGAGEAAGAGPGR
jgi:MscS family membrane protein